MDKQRRRRGIRHDGTRSDVMPLALNRTKTTAGIKRAAPPDGAENNIHDETSPTELSVSSCTPTATPTRESLVANANIETPDTEEWECDATPLLLRRMLSLDIDWSDTSPFPSRQRPNRLDDDIETASMLSMGSTSFVSSTPRRNPTRPRNPIAVIVTTPDFPSTRCRRASNTNTHSPSDSVFDRLYQHGRAKIRAERERSTQYPSRTTNRSANTFRQRGSSGMSIISSDSPLHPSEDSVYERLYRNETRSPRRLSTWSPSDSSSLQSSTSSWQRRLDYTPPMDVRKRRQRSRLTSRSANSTNASTAEATVNANSVFERLYRREPRPRSNLYSLPIHQRRLPSVNGTKRQITESIGCSAASHPENPSDSELELLAHEISLLTKEGHVTDDGSTSTTTRKDSELSMLAQELALLADGLEDEDSEDMRGFELVEPNLSSTWWIESQIIALQAAWRLRQRRAALNRERKYAITIQAYWRVYQVRKQRWLAFTKILEIQKVIRGYLARQMFRNMINRWNGDRHEVASISVLQRAWRSLSARQKFRSTKLSVLKVQATWRMYVQRTSYQDILERLENESFRSLFGNSKTLHDNDDFIGSHISDRANVDLFQNPAHNRNQDTRAYPVKIQSVWRGHKSRLVLPQQLSACRFAASIVSIQSWWRSYSTRRDLQSLEKAAVKVQSIWRMHSLLGYLKIRNASSTVIQSAYLGYVLRLCLFRRRAAIRRLEQRYIKRLRRTHQVRENYASAILQSCWRMHTIRDDYVYLRYNSIMVQSFIRKAVVRTRFLKELAAIITIEQWWRRWALHLLTLKETMARGARNDGATKIQAIWRAYHESRIVRTLRSKFILIQSVARQRSCNNLLKNRNDDRLALQVVRMTVHDQEAVLASYSTLFTKHSRGGAQVRQTKSNQTVAPATIIQKTWRMSTAFKGYSTLRSSSILLQSIIRQRHTTKILMSYPKHAIAIQTFWRKVHCVLNFRFIKSRTVTIQSHIRCHCKRLTFLRKGRALRLIQRSWRLWRAQIAFRDRRLHAILIQAKARCYLHRRNYSWYRRAATHIQSRWRVSEAGVDFRRVRTSALILQSHFRQVKVKSKWRKLQESLIMMQRCWRLYAARSKFLSCKFRSIVIQAFFRGVSARTRYVRAIKGSTDIQKCWRRYIVRAGLQHLRSATIIVQNSFRAVREKDSYVKSRMCAIMIQAIWRRFWGQHLFRLKQTSAIAIQSLWRVRLAFRVYLSRAAFCSKKQQIKRQMSAVAIQKAWRVLRATTEFNKVLFSIVKLQTCLRGWKQKNALRRQIAAVLALQKWFKTLLAARLVSRKRRWASSVKLQSMVRSAIWSRMLRKARSAAALIQRNYRMCRWRNAYRSSQISCVVIQSWWRKIHTKRQLATLCTSVLRIQASWRSRHNRVKLLDLREQLFTQRKVRANHARCLASKSSANRTLTPLLHREAQRIQACIRRHRSETDYTLLKEAVRRVQLMYYVSRLTQKTDQAKRAVALLTSSIDGQLSVRAGFVALLHLQLVFASKIPSSVVRLVRESDICSKMRLKAWKSEKATAENVICVLIQRSYRLYRQRQRAAFFLRRYPCNQGKTNTASFFAAPDATKNPYGRRAVSVKVIQQLDQQRLLVKFCHETFLRQRFAAMVLQGFWRELMALRSHQADGRRNVIATRGAEPFADGKQHVLRLHQEKRSLYCYRAEFAASIIQLRVRKYFFKCRHESNIAICSFRRHHAARVLQNFARQVYILRLRNKVIAKYICDRHAARILQIWFRNILCLQRKAIVQIQQQKALYVLQKFGRRVLLDSKSAVEVAVKKLLKTIDASSRQHTRDLLTARGGNLCLDRYALYLHQQQGDIRGNEHAARFSYSKSSWLDDSLHLSAQAHNIAPREDAFESLLSPIKPVREPSCSP